MKKKKPNKAKAKSGLVGLSRLSEERSDGIAGASAPCVTKFAA